MTIVYGYRHEDQEQARARYEQRERRETDAEWVRRRESEHRLSEDHRLSRQGEAIEYSRAIWPRLGAELTLGHAGAELLVRAIYLGSPVERAQAIHDVRYAIATRGIHGTPAYLTRMATTLAGIQGQERRAGMLSAIARAIDPANASDRMRGQQRRYWTGERGEDQPTPYAQTGQPPTPHTQGETSSRRRRRARR
jgi:hypothetical protein